MNAAARHRILRQSLEVQVDSESAAAELHAEISGSFREALAPALDDVFDAACPPDGMLRIDRVEIDLGIVPRDGLTAALTLGTRDRLAAWLAARHAALESGAPAADGISWMSAEEIALERIAVFLETGVMAWRDVGFTRAEIEEALLSLVERAPAALRAALRQLPPNRAARRLRAQVTPAARERLLAWLGIADSVDVEPIIAEWRAVLAVVVARARTRSIQASGRALIEWLFVRVWIAAVSGAGRVSAADVIGEAALELIMPPLRREHADPDAALVAAADECLPGTSIVRRFIARRATGAGPDNEHTRPMPTRRLDRMDVETTANPLAGAGVSTGGSGTTPSQPRAGGQSADWLRDDTVRPGTHVPERLSTHHDEPDRGHRRRAYERFREEPLWAPCAGVVIAWPFLREFFAACDLTSGRQFVDAAARERAVLLTAHLADGGDAWSEHELLLAKLLCGHPADEPVALSLDIRDEERSHAGEVLASIVGHWKRLKSTSADGLRRAFLTRDGALLAIASGWKLEIVRTGVDVLLDSLPWGIGVVVLPWMEQPLHVEW